MIMIVVLHGALLMVILPMLLSQISGSYQWRWFPYLTGLHKSQNASKIMLLKNWNCFKIFWRNSHLSDMHFSQKLQWVLLLQDCFNIQNVIPCSCQGYCFWQGSFWSLSKRRRKILHYTMLHFLVMLCYILSCFSWHILLLGQEFWVLQLIPHVLGAKSEIYYSPVTIHCYYSLSLFTPNFCLFKGGCPLYLK